MFGESVLFHGSWEGHLQSLCEGNAAFDFGFVRVVTIVEEAILEEDFVIFAKLQVETIRDLLIV